MKLELKLGRLLVAFIVSLLLFPSIISIRIGALPLITLPRILMAFCYVWIFLKEEILTRYWHAVKGIKYNAIIILYLVICAYTAFLRKDMNTFFGFFVDCFLSYFLYIFMLKEYVQTKDIIRVVTICLYVVCILGIIEFVTEINIFNELTIGNEKNIIPTSYRDDYLRVRGPYGHALAYGMMMLLLFPIACYDCNKNAINIFKDPVLGILIIINMLFTGARSGIGLVGLEFFLLYCFTDKVYRSRSTLTIIGMVMIGVCCICFFSDNILINYCLRQVFYAVDAVFDTNIALAYGGNASIGASSIARDRIWKILKSPELNPWLGRGVSNIGTYVIDGWRVTSIDNYYVMTYISLGLPGIVSLVLSFLQALKISLWKILKEKNTLNCACLVSTLIYMLNLLYVDELSTFRCFFAIVAIGQCCKAK